MKTVVLFITIIITIIEKSATTSTKDFLTNGTNIETIQISLFIDPEEKINITNIDKPILRYGFQKTQDCPVFDQAFLCIRKCLDLGYELAHADKNCLCSCNRNRILAKYKKPQFGPTKWKMGAPTTSLPPWAKKHTTKLSANVKFSPLDNYEIYGDVPYPGSDNQKINNETTEKKQAADKNHNTDNNESLGFKNNPIVHDETAAPEPNEETAAPEGQASTAAPDGQKSTAAPEGQESTAAPEGQESSAAPERQESSAAPEGQESSAAPEGQESSAAPEGQESSTAPEGQESTAAPGGN